jgi:hypothetical protein
LSLPIEPLYDEKIIYNVIEKLSEMWKVRRERWRDEDA